MLKEFLNATGPATAEFMTGPRAKLSKVEESDVLLQPLAGRLLFPAGWLERAEYSKPGYQGGKGKKSFR